MTEIVSWSITIFLFLMLPTYFISRWLLERKKRGARRDRIFTSIRIGIVVPVLIIVGSLAGVIALTTASPRDKFDENRWKNCHEQRYTMSRNIIKSRLLRGKTAEEVVKLLGKDNIVENDTSYMIYFTGYKPSIMTRVPQSLEIHFKNGKATDITKNITLQEIIYNYLEQRESLSVDEEQNN